MGVEKQNIFKRIGNLLRKKKSCNVPNDKSQTQISDKEAK